MVSAAALALAACSLARPSYRPLGVSEVTPAAVAGCYVVRRDGGAFGGWRDVVRLDTARVDARFARGLGLTDVFQLRVEGRDGDESPLVSDAWHTAAPDSLVLRRIVGFWGESIRLRLAGDSFAGTWTAGDDVVEADEVPPRVPVSLRRVACPARPLS